jgi:hypothetical protein
MEKPNYIEYLELQEGILSKMTFPKFSNEIIKYFDDKKIMRVFESGIVNGKGKARWDEVIYKTKHGFYIYFKSNREDSEEYFLDIYYKPETRAELLFFTTNILKPFKDGTINDGTVTEQN